jgi:hypothetical protein
MDLRSLGNYLGARLYINDPERARIETLKAEYVAAYGVPLSASTAQGIIDNENKEFELFKKLTRGFSENNKPTSPALSSKACPTLRPRTRSNPV